MMFPMSNRCRWARALDQSYTHNADISLGFGALFSVYQKTGNARAIYVPPE